MSKRECQLGFRTLQGTVNVVFCLHLKKKAYPICWDSVIDAWTSRLHADVFKVRLMKLNGASDLVLRAMRAKLTLFKSVTFSNYQQKKNELSLVSRRRLTCFHCSRMPSSLHPANSYQLFSLLPKNAQNTAALSSRPFPHAHHLSSTTLIEINLGCLVSKLLCYFI